MTRARETVHTVGTPPDWTGIDAEARVLCEQFDAFNARLRQLDREVEKWRRQARCTKDRATQTRLAGQARRFQEQYAKLGIEHSRLQAANTALQARSLDDTTGGPNDPH